MSIERLLNPRSIAVFGGAHAEELIRQCDRLGYTGEIYPVHPKKTEISGRKVYRSVMDLPTSPDAAYIGVNRNLTIDIIRDLALRDSGGAVCFATGFNEAGAEGAELQRQLLEASGNMPLIGPNCYGFINYTNGAVLWPDQQGGKRVDKGVAIITMSSNVGFNLTMQRRGLPIAYMMSLGNRLKFDIHDAIRLIAQQDEVTALGLYLETLPDPKAFEEAVNFARELGKPIVAIKTGRSDVGRKMVVSHTASLAGSDALVSALFERLGVARVESLEALIESLKVLHVLGPLSGGRIGAMSTSGGDLTLLADALPSGLSMPPLSHGVIEQLKSVVHEQVKPSNPFDYQMFSWNDEEQNVKNFNTFLSEGFDVSLCLLDYPRADRCDQSSWGNTERGFVRSLKETNTKGAVMTTFTDTVDEVISERLMEQGVVMLAGVDTGIAAVKAAMEIGTVWKKPLEKPILGNVKEVDEEARMLDEAEAKDVLRLLGVNVPEGKKAEGVEQAIAEAEAMGYPVVVKALGVAHKTDVGGVKLNLRNAEEVAGAVLSMQHITNTFLIERMFHDALAELLVGVTRDEQFGLHLVVGTGGVWVEMMADTVSLLLPTTREEVEKAIRGLKISLVLDGFRGAKPADVKAGVEIIMQVAQLVEQNASAIMEMEINPLLLLPEGQGAVAVDALVRVRGELHE